MKRFFTLFIGLGALSVMLLSHSNGVFTSDYTGSANSSTQHCASAGCHSSGGFSGDGTIDIQVLSGVTPVWSYTPGATYTISVTRPASNYTKIGMQSGAMLWASSTPTGTITNTINPANLQLNSVSGGNMISHTTLGSTAAITAGNATWKYSWTAPATDVGAIDIYAIMNLTNNDGTISGDSVVRNIFTLQKPSAVGQFKKLAANISLYPNPAQNTLSFSSQNQLNGNYTITIFSLLGHKVTNTTISNNLAQEKIDISGFPSSIYICSIEQNGAFSLLPFTKN